jgi:hypothetical protein
MEFYHISPTKLHSDNGFAEIRQSAGHYVCGICERIPGVYLTGLNSLNSWCGILASLHGLEFELSNPVAIIDIDGRKDVRKFDICKSPIYLYIVEIPDNEIVNFTEFAYSYQENEQILAKDFVDNDTWGEVSEVVVQHDCVGRFVGELYNKIVPNAGNYGNCIWDFN